jgi:hypothetical protein
MEPEVLAGMIFTLILVMLIGGFIVLFPVTRRLGALLESKMRPEQRAAAKPSSEELIQVRDALLSIEQQLRALAERQEFTEQLLASRERTSLPRGTSIDHDRD